MSLIENLLEEITGNVTCKLSMEMMENTIIKEKINEEAEKIVEKMKEEVTEVVGKKIRIRRISAELQLLLREGYEYYDNDDGNIVVTENDIEFKLLLPLDYPINMPQVYLKFRNSDGFSYKSANDLVVDSHGAVSMSDLIKKWTPMYRFIDIIKKIESELPTVMKT